MMSYYAQLDTVEFAAGHDEARVHSRSAAATAAVTLDMLLRDETPVLSQTQVFDHPLVLAEAAAHPRGDSPLIALIKASRIQCRIFPRGLIPRGDEDQTFTIVNAFLSRLASDNGFVFTAWPELNADPALRGAVSATLSGQTTAALDPQIEERLTALRMLDDAFRTSTAHERAEDVTGPSLSRRVHQHLTAQGVPRAAREAYQSLMHWAEENPRGYNLDARSGWDTLLKAHREASDDTLANPQHLVEAVVHARYNEIVAESLGQRVVVDDKRRGLSQVLEGGGLTGEYHDMATALVPAPGEGSRLLSWGTVQRLLLDYDTADLGVADRVRHLFETKVIEEVDGLPLVRLARFAPRFYSSVATGASTSALTGVVTSNAWVGLITGALASGATRTIPDERVPGVARLGSWAESFASRQGVTVRTSLLARHRS